jgi:hypothetical protein
MTWQRTGLWLIAGAALAVSAGCPLPSSRELAVQWATPLNDLGLVVVDPPREDLRVGDVYLYSTDPETEKSTTAYGASQRRIGMVSRWTTLPVLAEVETEYQERPAWPPRSAGGTQGGVAAEGTPAPLRPISLFGASATITGREEASALIPAELNNLVPGLSFDDYKGITITVTGAEMYALGLDSVLGLLVEEPADGDESRVVLRERYRRFLPVMALADSDVVWLRVVSEVVYMRTLDYTVQPAVPPDSVEDVPPPDMTAFKRPPPMIAAPSGDPAVMPFERAEHINRLLEASGTARTPDVTTRIMAVTDKSASLRMEWLRGLAIAVRGLTLEVDKNSGAVLRLGSMGEALPRRRTGQEAPDS